MRPAFSELHRVPSYVQGANQKSLIGQTIGMFFDDIVARFSKNEAFVSRHQGLRFTYCHLSDKIEEVAMSLLASGVKKGDRVGIWSPNNVGKWDLVSNDSGPGGIWLNVFDQIWGPN